MNYIWTEDSGAGLHYWNLVNECLLQNKCVVESKGSNQGILDAVRELTPQESDKYFLAFDIVYDNMDVMNKYLELKELAAKHPGQIIILDMICFEHIYGYLEIRLNELLQKKGLSKSKLLHKAEMNWKQIDNYCTNSITRLDVYVLCKLCTELVCEIQNLLEFIRRGRISQ